MKRRSKKIRKLCLLSAIYEIRQLVNSNSKEIIVPFYPDVQLEGVQYVIPQRGDQEINYWICPKEMYPILDWIENGRGI